MNLFKPASSQNLEERKDLMPKNMEEAIDQYLLGMSDKDKKSLTNAKETDNMVVYGHWFDRMNLRNSLNLWGDNPLTLYFRYIGITHADDMGTMLITCVHRRLNNRPIDIERQVQFYQDYWKKSGYPDGMPK